MYVHTCTSRHIPINICLLYIFLENKISPLNVIFYLCYRWSPLKPPERWWRHIRKQSTTTTTIASSRIKYVYGLFNFSRDWVTQNMNWHSSKSKLCCLLLNREVVLIWSLFFVRFFMYLYGENCFQVLAFITQYDLFMNLIEDAACFSVVYVIYFTYIDITPCLTFNGIESGAVLTKNCDATHLTWKQL